MIFYFLIFHSPLFLPLFVRISMSKLKGSFNTIYLMVNVVNFFPSSSSRNKKRIFNIFCRFGMVKNKNMTKIQQVFFRCFLVLSTVIAFLLKSRLLKSFHVADKQATIYFTLRNLWIKRWRMKRRVFRGDLKKLLEFLVENVLKNLKK